MVALNKRPASKRVTVRLDEARSLAAALFLVMTHMPPPDCVAEQLDALVNRILEAFGMDITVCGDCGDVTVGGKVVLVTAPYGEEEGE